MIYFSKVFPSEILSFLKNNYCSFSPKHVLSVGFNGRKISILVCILQQIFLAGICQSVKKFLTGHPFLL